MITILKGGTSAERQVSLWTAESVADALGSLRIPFNEVDAADADWLQQVTSQKPETVIIALHGPFGEDGQVQKLLEDQGIPYTGSSSVTSQLTIDKAKTKAVLSEKTNIATPQSALFKKGEQVSWDDAYPVVVKPNGDGSSFGVTIVANEAQLQQAVTDAFTYGEAILLESWVSGREFTCGVIDVGQGLQVLPIVEIVPKDSFFSFEAKYTASKCDEICPANLDGATAEQIQDLSLQAFMQLGCRHYARVDWILGQDGTPYFLEINTLPGMTKTSLIPKELAASGISYPDFLSALILQSQQK